MVVKSMDEMNFLQAFLYSSLNNWGWELEQVFINNCDNFYGGNAM